MIKAETRRVVRMIKRKCLPVSSIIDCPIRTSKNARRISIKLSARPPRMSQRQIFARRKANSIYSSSSKCTLGKSFLLRSWRILAKFSSMRIL